MTTSTCPEKEEANDDDPNNYCKMSFRTVVEVQEAQVLGNEDEDLEETGTSDTTSKTSIIVGTVIGVIALGVSGYFLTKYVLARRKKKEAAKVIQRLKDKEAGSSQIHLQSKKAAGTNATILGSNANVKGSQNSFNEMMAQQKIREEMFNESNNAHNKDSLYD